MMENVTFQAEKVLGKDQVEKALQESLKDSKARSTSKETKVS